MSYNSYWRAQWMSPLPNVNSSHYHTWHMAHFFLWSLIWQSLKRTLSITYSLRRQPCGIYVDLLLEVLHNNFHILLSLSVTLDEVLFHYITTQTLLGVPSWCAKFTSVKQHSKLIFHAFFYFPCFLLNIVNLFPAPILIFSNSCGLINWYKLSCVKLESNQVRNWGYSLEIYLNCL